MSALAITHHYTDVVHRLDHDAIASSIQNACVSGTIVSLSRLVTRHNVSDYFKVVPREPHWTHTYHINIEPNQEKTRQWAAAADT
jgi:hypothetical protein